MVQREVEQGRRMGYAGAIVLMSSLALGSLVCLLAPMMGNANGHGGGLQAAAALALVFSIRGLQLSQRGRHHLGVATAALSAAPLLYLATESWESALLLVVTSLGGIALEWWEKRLRPGH